MNKRLNTFVPYLYLITLELPYRQLTRNRVRVSKLLYKNICIKAYGLWGWRLVSVSVSLSIIRCTIAANVFSSNLKTHKRQIFPMIAPCRVAKLSTSPKVTSFLPPLPCYSISDQCLKGDHSSTLFLRNSIVAMDLWSLWAHKT